MPHYEICYLDDRGALIGAVTLPCSGDKQARIQAHAMRLAGTRRIEVWDGARLVYERPQTERAVFIDTPLPQTGLRAAE